jgi:hypothetical protein
VRRALVLLAAAVAGAVVVAGGCGLQVQAADLFLVTRSGQGQKLTLVVADDGTISCDGAKPKPLPDALLLQARDLSTSLNDDAKAKLRLTTSPRSVFSYTVKVSNGTFKFPDTAAVRRKELSQLELFVVQAATQGCGINS